MTGSNTTLGAHSRYPDAYNTDVRPRIVAWQGVVLAAGVLLDQQHPLRTSSHAAVAAGWRTGDSLVEWPGLVFWRFRTPREVHTDTLPGRAVVALSGNHAPFRVQPLMSAVPLDPEELHAVAAQTAALATTAAHRPHLAWSEGAQVMVGGIDAMLPVSPTRLADATSIAVADTFPILAPPAAITADTLDAPPSTDDVLGVGTLGDKDLRAKRNLLAALDNNPSQTNAPGEASNSPAASNGTPSADGRSDAGQGSKAPSLWNKIKSAFGTVTGSSNAALHKAMRSDGPLPDAPAEGRERTNKLQEMIERLPWLNNHESYLDHMLDLFEQGNFEEALRHAIRLDGQNADGPTKQAGRLQPRADLRIGTQLNPINSTVQTQGPLHNRLRHTYETALQRVIDLGDFRKAAFMLIELLGRVPEGIAMLEEHGLYTEAAQVAEGRELDPALVVRLWFLAGDRERALATARLHGVYADAVRRLEAGHPNEAMALRLLWANELAKAGNYAQAVRAWRGSRTDLDAVPGLPLAQTWAQRAVDGGGIEALRTRFDRLQFGWGDGIIDAEALLEQFATEGGTAARERAMLAPDITRAVNTAVVRPIISQWARATLADQAVHGPLGVSTTMLLNAIGRDPALRVDTPRSWSGTGMAAAPIDVVFSAATPTGLVPRDAIPTGDGRAVIALGALGAALVNADGRIQTQFDVPSDALVAISPEQCLSIRRFEQRVFVSKINVAKRERTELGSIAITCFAPHAEDGLWFVVEGGNRLVALDLNAPNITTSLWSVRVEGRIMGVQSIGKNVNMVVVHEDRIERWVYERRAMQLRARADFPLSALGGRCTIVGDHAKLDTQFEEGVASPVISANALLGFDLQSMFHLTDVVDTHAAAHLPNSSAIAWVEHDAARVEIQATRVTARLASVRLPGVRQLRLRAVSNDSYMLCDDTGRVTQLDVATRAILGRWTPSI